MSISAYPLSWPAGWKRTSPGLRQRAKFGKSKSLATQFGSYSRKESLTVADGLKRVLSALDRMGIPDRLVIISTNMPVRQDGLPYSGRKDPEDPGAAVYWREPGSKPDAVHRCMAIDQYDRLADNLAALAGTLEALRAVERWGGAEILDRAFTGFQALPERVGTGWWVTLEVPRDADPARVEHAYKILRSRHHPDRGGDPEKFHQVQEAYQAYQSSRRETA